MAIAESIRVRHRLEAIAAPLISSGVLTRRALEASLLTVTGHDDVKAIAKSAAEYESVLIKQGGVVPEQKNVAPGTDSGTGDDERLRKANERLSRTQEADRSLQLEIERAEESLRDSQETIDEFLSEHPARVAALRGEIDSVKAEIEAALSEGVQQDQSEHDRQTDADAAREHRERKYSEVIAQL